MTAPLILAVEVLSPSTRRKDQLLKRSKYQDAGVQTYWIIDPAEPSLLALDLTGGTYATTAHARGTERATLSTRSQSTSYPQTWSVPPRKETEGRKR